MPVHRYIIIILAIFLIIVKPCQAGDKLGEFKGLEFLSGYGQAELSQNEDYRVVPLAVAFDFNIKPLTSKLGFNPAGLVEFQIEPFLNLIATPEGNLETGTAFLLKFGLFPETWKFQPYIKAGTGVIWMSQHTLEQSTQFNFISSAGAGLHYFLNKKNAFTLEYRFRHLSNAGIKHPNRGIDHHFCLLGLTRLF
jgi:hypothetical protein